MWNACKFSFFNVMHRSKKGKSKKNNFTKLSIFELRKNIYFIVPFGFDCIKLDQIFHRIIYPTFKVDYILSIYMQHIVKPILALGLQILS